MVHPTASWALPSLMIYSAQSTKMPDKGGWYVVGGRWGKTSPPHTTYYLPPTVLLYSMRGNSEEQFEQAREMDLANLPQQNRKRLNPDSKVGSRRSSRIT